MLKRAMWTVYQSLLVWAKVIAVGVASLGAIFAAMWLASRLF
jgi:hypothetical protein